MIVARQGDWLSARVGSELIMMSVHEGHYLGLTEIGAYIWDLIEVPRELDSLCTVLVAEFDVSEEICRMDVTRFLETLQSHGAVTLDPPATT